jgi:hypothetical protein
MILGLMIAIILQQEGIWPLDQLLVFGLVGLFGLLGSWLGRVGRASVGGFSMITPLLLALALIVVGALGAAAAGENGRLDGSCTVAAQSSVDSTTVVDTSKSDPFDIDPDGSLSWQAASDPAITDHNWEISVEFAGFDIPMESGGDPNEAETPGNSDTIEDLTAYIQEVTNVSGQEVRGVFKVGGFIAQDTAVICDGFAFVRLTSDSPLESLVAKIAAGLALLSLLLLLTLLFRRGDDTDVDFTGDGPGAGDLDSAGVSAAAGGTAAAGETAGTGAPSEPEPGPEPEVGPGAGASDEDGPEPGEEDLRRPDNLA